MAHLGTACAADPERAEQLFELAEQRKLSAIARTAEAIRGATAAQLLGVAGAKENEWQIVPVGTPVGHMLARIAARGRGPFPHVAGEIGDALRAVAGGEACRQAGPGRGTRTARRRDPA